MKVSALQKFLSSLASPLGAVGVAPQALADLAAVAEVLNAFHDLDLAQLTDFLRRAAEKRQNAEVPVVFVPGLDGTNAAARSLNDFVHKLVLSEPAGLEEVEEQTSRAREQLQTELTTLAGAFGFALSFKDKSKNWVSSLSTQAKTRHATEAATIAAAKRAEEEKAAISKAVEGLRQLAKQISAPESYENDSVKLAIQDLAATDAKILKSAATELNVTASGTGTKFVQALVVKLTNISDKKAKPKAPRKSKDSSQPNEPKIPNASDEKLEAIIEQLQDMVERSKDPAAVSNDEIEALLARVSNEFAPLQRKTIAERITKEKITTKGEDAAEEAIKRLRTELTAVKSLIENQNV